MSEQKTVLDITKYLDESFWEWLIGEKDLFGVSYGDELVLDRFLRNSDRQQPKITFIHLKHRLKTAILKYLSLNGILPRGGLINQKEPVTVGKVVLWEGCEE